MAKICDIDQDGWNEWVSTRPASVQAVCKRLPPNLLYLLKTSNHRVTIYSYSEDGTVTVNVTGEYNFVAFPRQVFGINPDDLEECDLPTEGEPLGEMLSEREDVDAYIDAIRPAVLAERAANESTGERS